MAGRTFFFVALLIILGYLASIGLILDARDIARGDSIESKPWFSIENATDGLATQGTLGLTWLAAAIGLLLLGVDQLLSKLGR